jgi:predicted nucleic acid-binding Zn ribbon protein
MSDIPAHRHCPVCGISIPPEEEFCSKKCERAWEDAMRRKRKSAAIMWALIGVLVSLAVFMMLSPK